MAMLNNQRVNQNQFNAQLLVSNIIQTPQWNWGNVNRGFLKPWEINWDVRPEYW